MDLSQEDLAKFLKRLKTMGYSKNTGYQQHSRPDDLSVVIRERLVDYIAMDIKAPFGKDAAIAGVQVDTDAIRERIRVTVRSGVKYQFRTTKSDVLLDDENTELIHEYIDRTGKYDIQQFNPYVNSAG